MQRFWQWWSCFFGFHEEWYLVARAEDGATLWPRTTLLYECYGCKKHRQIVLEGKLVAPVPPVHTPARGNGNTLGSAPKTSRWKA
jgi:hypothetical protein